MPNTPNSIDRHLILFLVFFLLAGCSTQILRPDLMPQTTKEPQLEDYYDRWIFGLIGDTQIDPQEACVDQTAVYYKERTSLEDFILGLITLGIYVPETVYVWCVSEPSTLSQN